MLFLHVNGLSWQISFLIIAALLSAVERWIDPTIVGWPRKEIECAHIRLLDVPRLLRIAPTWLHQTVLAHQVVGEWLVYIHLQLEHFH